MVFVRVPAVRWIDTWANLVALKDTSTCDVLVSVGLNWGCMVNQTVWFVQELSSMLYSELVPVMYRHLSLCCNICLYA